MGDAVVALPSRSALTAFVHRTLCEPDALSVEQTPLFETPIRRGGKAIGVLFHIEGPRRLSTSAVWAADDGRILFYDSTGTRCRAVRLSEGPVVG